MRKLYSSLLVMLIVSLFGFKASAATLPVTINIDNPEAVTISQDDWSSGSLNVITHTLTSQSNAVNLVDPWGNGTTSFDIAPKDGVTLTSVTVNGEENVQWMYNGKLNCYIQAAGAIINISTSGSPSGGGGGVTTTSHFTINVDDASKVEVFKKDTMSDYKLSLYNGSNSIEFNPSTDLPILIRNAQGVNHRLTSVKFNNTEVSYIENQPYTINPADGDVIDIVTASTAPVTQYTLSFAAGCNLAAISSIENMSSTPFSGWQSGSLRLEEGTQGFIYFDNDNYTITDLTRNGEAMTYYGYGVYFEMTQDLEFSFTATPKGGQQQTFNSVRFLINNWTGNTDGEALIINRGESAWDTEVQYNTSDFTEEFTSDSQKYFIQTTGDYRLKSVKKTHNGTTSNVALATTYGVEGSIKIANAIEVYDGDLIEITLEKFVNLYTATLNVSATIDTEQYTGDIYLSNQSGHISKEYIGNGSYSFHFNPNDNSDRRFTLSCRTNQTGTNIYSVKLNGNTVPGTSGTYNLGSLNDGDNLEIIAADPTLDTRVPAEIEFDSDNNPTAISRVLVNSIDLSSSAYAPGASYTGAFVGNSFKIIFNQGYIIENLVFGSETYNWDSTKPNITQPLEYLESADCYQFSGTITQDYMGVSFTATAIAAPTYSKSVTFNVNIPAGVKITDITDSANKVVIPVNKTPYAHTFTAEYNYIDIEGAEGYDLISVSVNPNDGNNISNPTPSDNKVGSVMVDNNYIVNITVEEHAVEPPTPGFGSATITVVGNPEQIRLLDEDNEEITLQAGPNTITLTDEECYYLVEQVGDGVESVTINGEEVEPRNAGTKKNPKYVFDLEDITDDDQIVITTVGSEPPAPTTGSFTITINGDASKIDYLMEQFSPYSQTKTFATGDNIITLPNNTDSFEYGMSASVALYSVKLNGNTIAGQYGGTIYMFSAKNGDRLVIDTEFPQRNVKVTWDFDGCNSSILTGIQIGDGSMITPEDNGFASYLNGFSVPLGTAVTYTIDTTNFNVIAVTHNGDNQLTGANHYFAVTSDTYIRITAAQKRVYTYTLTTNMPNRLMAYHGAYGNGQTIELSTTTQLEVNEITGDTYITAGPAYGYYFDEANCTMDGERLTLNDEGHYVIYPQENSVVTLTLSEVARPMAAAIYVDNLDVFESMLLTSGRFEAFSSSDPDAESGYHIFHFNADDRGEEGFSLNISAIEDVTPIVYINNVLQEFNTDTKQITGIMLSDGDIVKVYSSEDEPTLNALVIDDSMADTELFTVTIDRISTHIPVARQSAAAHAPARSSSQALTGTEVSITAAPEAHNPWVQIDGNMTPFNPGTSYTFYTSGDHEIAYGQNYDAVITGIDKVIFDITSAGDTDIYNLQGVCVKRSATAADIKALAPGVYVIGRHKVRVR